MHPSHKDYKMCSLIKDCSISLLSKLEEIIISCRFAIQTTEEVVDVNVWVQDNTEKAKGPSKT